jgi:uncharacterized protein YneF (UPF0154 family)
VDPDHIKILSLGAIWNLGKVTWLSRAATRLQVTKGPSIRLRCIRTLMAQTQYHPINPFVFVNCTVNFKILIELGF